MKQEFCACYSRQTGAIFQTIDVVRLSIKELILLTRSRLTATVLCEVSASNPVFGKSGKAWFARKKGNGSLRCFRKDAALDC